MLAHANSVSPWPRLVSRDSRGYKNLSTVEVGLQVVCLCQRFDRQSPTLNLYNPIHSLTVFAQCNNPFITFGLSLFAPSLPRIPKPILTRPGISDFRDIAEFRASVHLSEISRSSQSPNPPSAPVSGLVAENLSSGIERHEDIISIVYKTTD